MRYYLFVSAIMIVLAGSVSADAKIVGKAVDYIANGVTMKGFLAWDDSIKGKRPGVLVVHEWWGLNEHARSRARRLAGMGYAALAVDMYGEGKEATRPDDASKFSSELFKNFDVMNQSRPGSLCFMVGPTAWWVPSESRHSAKK